MTPPPEEVGALLDDLVAFANRTDLDPVTQSAVAHAQFELVHPYATATGESGVPALGGPPCRGPR